MTTRARDWLHAATRGALDARAFLRRHWQKKPLFLAGALAEFAEAFEPRTILELATRDDVESRLVRHEGRRWSVEHGPFPRAFFRRLPPRGWSLLVQGVEAHLPAARALMDRFAFVPYARQDDVMLSLAPPGGGVGPHYDSYDVFLLQVWGRRRWRIGASRDLTLVPDAPLRILKSFRPERTHLVEPGDVLYLPPRHAHEGVAITDCITCSVGFRAPTKQELVTSFLQWLPEQLALEGMYGDRDLALPRHPAQIGDGFVAAAEAMLSSVRWSRATVERFLGEYLSEPKPQVWFQPPQPPLAFRAFARHARRAGVRLAAATRMLFRNGLVFVNGESVRVKGEARAALVALADARAAVPWRSTSEHALRLVYEWYRAGYVELA